MKGDALHTEPYGARPQRVTNPPKATLVARNGKSPGMPRRETRSPLPFVASTHRVRSPSTGQGPPSSSCRPGRSGASCGDTTPETRAYRISPQGRWRPCASRYPHSRARLNARPRRRWAWEVRRRARWERVRRSLRSPRKRVQWRSFCGGKATLIVGYRRRRGLGSALTPVSRPANVRRRKYGCHTQDS